MVFSGARPISSFVALFRGSFMAGKYVRCLAARWCQIGVAALMMRARLINLHDRAVQMVFSSFLCVRSCINLQ